MAVSFPPLPAGPLWAGVANGNFSQAFQSAINAQVVAPRLAQLAATDPAGLLAVIGPGAAGLAEAQPAPVADLSHMAKRPPPGPRLRPADVPAAYVLHGKRPPAGLGHV